LIRGISTANPVEDVNDMYVPLAMIMTIMMMITGEEVEYHHAMDH